MTATNVTFIETPFIATHTHYTGGDVMIIGIGSPMVAPQNRQVVFMNSNRELFFTPLEVFVAKLPNGFPRFRPKSDAVDLIRMVDSPTIKGNVKDFDKG